MTLAGKKRLVGLLLGLVTLWPLVHGTLVVRYGVNPWKLGGFGMYSVPQPKPEVEVFIAEGQAWVPSRTAHWSEESRAELRRFLGNRSALGQLATPHKLAEALLRDRNLVPAVAIVVVEPRLDLSSGLIVANRTRFEYPPR